MSLRVDSATGATSLYAVDVRLPGFLPLTLARQYRSDRQHQGPLGVGWHLNLDCSLQIASGRVTYHGAAGRPVPFRAVDVGVQVQNEETGYVLQHHADAYVVFRSPLIHQVFLKKNAAGGTHRLDRIEATGGHVIQVVYKGPHLIAFIDTLGRRVQCAYANDRLSALQVVGRDGSEQKTVRQFRYDAQGDLVAAIDAEKRETRYTYQRHLMVTCENPLGGRHYARYDKDGRCLMLWRSDGSHARRLAYDDLRQSTHVTDANGYQSVYRHIDRAQTLAHITPDATGQHFAYDDRQRLMSFSSADGSTGALQQVDEEGGTLVQVEGEQRVAFVTLNAQGLADEVADAYGQAYRLAYDDAGTLARLTTPTAAVWTFERDTDGRVVAVVSPEERRVRLKYRSRGRTCTIKDALGLRYTEHYDLFGRLTERTDARERREQLTYDAEGRLTTIKIEGAYEARFTYDAAGHLASATDSRRRDYKLQYDAFGRLVGRIGPDGGAWQFGYDPEGRLVRAARQGGQTATFGYDWQGRLVESVAFDGRRTSYRYDEDGAVTVDAGQDDGTVRVYSPLLDLLEERRGDEAERRYTYGPCGELVTVERAGGTLTFDYDDEGRLATVQAAGDTLTLTYDGDGNLLTARDDDGREVALTYDARCRPETVQVDGREVARPAYDAGNRLTAMHAPDGTHHVLSYDALDRLGERRIERTGQPAAAHRFRSRDRQALADPVGPVDSDTALEATSALRLVLHQSRQGLVLAVHRGELHVPIWLQTHYLARGAGPLTSFVVRACLHGVDAVLQGLALPLGPDLLRRWVQATFTDRRFLFTDVPTASEVGMPWPALQAFFLRRRFFDAAYPQHAPGYVDHHQDDLLRAVDRDLTGSHMTSYVRPSLWPTRAVGSFMSPWRAAHARGGLHPEDVLLLFAD